MAYFVYYVGVDRACGMGLAESCVVIMYAWVMEVMTACLISSNS